MGYTGNLKERSVELTGFWVLSMLSLGATLFFLFGQKLRTPLDLAVNILKLVYDSLSVVIGYVTVKHMMKTQTIRFHVNHFVSDQPVDAGSPQPSPVRGSPVRRIGMSMGTL
eukprot:TRINITY_DN13425_c0_g1_i10.p2 TRINITY_DN13425_c0_g1~~TRINITY_DN13425_c0_g1_i10.p2  ORF type:complete len:112 (-),score=19.91 TRINITY_DN13425_c0_g1_i10:335-670(-)